MFINGYVAAIESCLLAMEASKVIYLRMERLASGGSTAQHEAELMISEKIAAFSQTGFDLLSGASHSKICSDLRAAVQLNDERLTALRDIKQNAAQA